MLAFQMSSEKLSVPSEPAHAVGKPRRATARDVPTRAARARQPVGRAGANQVGQDVAGGDELGEG